MVLAAPVALLPWLGTMLMGRHAGEAGAAETKVLDTFTPMDALKNKDYGKPRIK